MKKALSVILMIFLLLVSIGCGKETVNQSTVLKNFHINAAIKTVDSYMNAVMKNDVNAENKLYASNFKKTNNNNVKVQNLIVNGYILDEITQAGDMGVIDVKVSKINSSVPYASLETQTFKIIREDNAYRIKSIDIKNEKEIFASGINNQQIRMRIKTNVKTNLVTNFDGMPKYYYTQDDHAKNHKIPISIGEFGIIGLSYDGNSGFITTKGKNPYIEVVNFDESLATQGGTSSGGDQEGGDSSGAGGGGGTQNNVAPEKPISKDMVALEVIPNAVINNSIYSQNGRFLVIQYTKNSSGNTLKMYKCEDGKQISFDFEKNYPIDKVDVTIVNFVKKGLIYRVTPRAEYVNDNSLKDIIGTWEIDTDKFKTKAVNEAKANSEL
jgi:hypothetical protein